MPKPTLIICGSIAIDRIMNFSGRYRDLIKPDKLHVLSVSMLLDKLEDSRGGIGANIASNLAQLGERPILLGSIGNDAVSYMEDLESLGVDTSYLHYSHLPTASFNVITDSENNQVGGFYQGAMSDADALSFQPWQDKEALALISAHNPAAMNRQVTECHDYGVRLVYDPGQQVSDPTTDLKAGVMAAEILFANDYERSVLSECTGMSPEQLAAQLPIMITTYGKEGSIIEGTRLEAPLKIGIATPDAVVDPTGAGDAYRAGFLYGYLRQWELRACGQLGAVMASYIIEKHGTQQQLSLPAIKQRYKDTFNEELTL